MKQLVMNKALFLDRDGVINIDKHYVYRIEDFEFAEGIFDLCNLARKLSFMLFVITNQAGIGRGYYTVADYEKLTDWMLEQFAARGVPIEQVYYCPFHPTAGVGEYRKDSFDRKPNPGMILRAQKTFGLNLSKSILLGDKSSDIEAGLTAGVKYNVKLIHEGETSENSPGKLEFSSLHAIEEWFRHIFS